VVESIKEPPRPVLQRRFLAIAEDEDRAAERIVPKGLLAKLCQSVDTPAKIGRLDGREDLHLRGDLEQHRALQKLRDSAAISAAS
jgi:hypothetical protein